MGEHALSAMLTSHLFLLAILVLISGIVFLVFLRYIHRKSAEALSGSTKVKKSLREEREFTAIVKNRKAGRPTV